MKKGITKFWIYIIIFFAVVFVIKYVKENPNSFVGEKAREILKQEDEIEEVEIDLSSFNKKDNEEVSKEELVKEEILEIDYEKIKPNELLEIPVIMYHGLTEKPSKNVYRRTIEDFEGDLKYLYENDFRLISMEEFISGKIDVEAGKHPIVFTWDDGLDTSFSMVRNENGDLIVKENTAVDIMNKFAEEYPDFGKASIFYVNGNNNPFQGEGTLEEKFKYLLDNGYELGNHTYTHCNFTNKTSEEMQKEIGKVESMLADNIEGYVGKTLSLPFGSSPKNQDLNKFLFDGKYENTEYNYLIAFKEGPSIPKFYPYYHAKYPKLKAPRLRGDDKNSWDMGDFLRKYKQNPSRLYVSDGNPNRISVPAGTEDNINKDRLPEGIDIYTY
ncbi:MAG: polysaccharide deacetylase family protein [Clostridia bacterium]|jgi:peptidoglycan/xylan/chitin deacetylase (PgdA/CDA1 family)|nr:polysaccharide deacetylase family protein [Clostridia bacterium]